jgi:hypothetical protein
MSESIGSSNLSTLRFSSKIASVSVATKPLAETQPAAPSRPEPQKINEHLARPYELEGRTYKIKPPGFENALYLTINDIVLNEGTDHESRLPFEIFINSKEMDSYQWVVALTRLISAVFRKGGDTMFLLEELKSVFDPNGGFFSRQQRMPSLVAEIGYVIEDHFKWLGLIKPEGLSQETVAFIESKKEAYTASGGDFKNATVCKACGAKAVIILDRCPTCTSCGDSKCG